MGLNHIPMRPTTSFASCIATILDEFIQVAQIFKLDDLDFPMDSALTWLRDVCLERLKASSRNNQFGFRSSEIDLMHDEVANNKLNWLLQHLYCSGLDKAGNNPSFVCIKHIRLMALERLSGPDYLPCKEESLWMLSSTILDLTSQEILCLVPELQISYQTLPYLMSTYKLHKNKYYWLTNAFHTIYSNVAHLLTIANMKVLESVKEWVQLKQTLYSQFLKVEMSMVWLINSSVKMALNLPDKINDLFVADITRCYESILLIGPNNLLDAVAFVIKIGYKHVKSLHPRSISLIWIRVDSNGQVAHAQWASSRPTYGECFSLSTERFIKIHRWLMNSCYVNLGDRVWKQILGIQMGFSCSPLWCNIYLLYYELMFIMRLTRLGRADLISKFQSVFCYIDDLCWLNTGNPNEFLNPLEPRIETNPM